MCTVLDYAENKGRQEECEKVILNALKADFSIVSILKLGYSKETVHSVAKKNNLPIDL